VLKTDDAASVAGTGREGIDGNGNQPNYLSAVERGKVKMEAEILFRISREFAKSVEWPANGER